MALRSSAAGADCRHCIEYGPFSAPIAGTYHFALEYELLEGGIVAGLLSQDKRRWLRSSSREDAVGDRRTLVFSAALRRGQTCWLTLSNNHEPGGVSRFVVTNLGASVEPRDLVAMLVTSIRFSTVRAPYWRGQEITDAGDGVRLPLEIWRTGDSRDSTRIERTADGLAVNTDPRRWSYALEAGPIRAVARGTHSFTLTYDLAEGGISLGVLDRDKSRWLRPPFADAAPSGHQTLTTTVDLKKGQLFWLIVANSHPQGGHPSGFVLRALASTVEPMSWRSWQTKAIGRWRKDVADRIDDGFARLRGRLAGLVRRVSAPTIGAASGARRLVNRVRVGIVRNSPEYAAMRTSLQTLEREHRAVVAQVSRLERPVSPAQAVARSPARPAPSERLRRFSLMAREHWDELKGYPEFQNISMNIDGLLSSVAYYAESRSARSTHRITFITSNMKSARAGRRKARRSFAVASPSAASRGWTPGTSTSGAWFMPLAPAADDFQYVRLGFRRSSVVRVDRRAPRGFSVTAETANAGVDDARPLRRLQRLVRTLIGGNRRFRESAAPEPHPVFSRFADYEGWAEPGFERGFYGINIRDWLYLGQSKKVCRQDRRAVHVGHPSIDEEYFEWIALLAAISAARGRFCMAELGAGWGRWMASAAVLCRQKGIEFSLFRSASRPSRRTSTG